MIAERRIALASGVTLNVTTAGDPSLPPVVLLHGFPESHRTWRLVSPLLAPHFHLVMPDLRGFGESDRPLDVADYATDRLVADIFALADALGIGDFALVGHDWGGAMAWAAALSGNGRLDRLAIVNAPHPLIFQRSLIDDPAQRAASQYIRAFRSPTMEAAIERMGVAAFFDTSFGGHVDLAAIDPAERERSIAEWSRPGALTAMFNWYRASHILVPEAGEAAAVPSWLQRAISVLQMPTLIVWGMDDRALLPVQLLGLDALVADLDVVRLPGVGHFAPWQAPNAVAAALLPFLGAAARA